MKQQCYHCMTIRDRAKLFEEREGVWICRSRQECAQFIAKLPDWLKV